MTTKHETNLGDLPILALKKANRFDFLKCLLQGFIEEAQNCYDQALSRETFRQHTQLRKIDLATKKLL
jgi:hypothetical protein